MPSFRSSALVLAAVALASTTACGALRRLAGNDTVNLEKADVKSMSVDIRRTNKTICPREPVQMGVFMEVVLDGDKDAKQVETYVGRGGVNKNDKLEFTDFAFVSPQGTFDQEGFFSPNPDVTLTAGKEFEIKSVFRRRPDKFTFDTTYKPDYTCIHGSGASGPSGHSGASGDSGKTGASGSGGSSSSPGGNGGDGSPGGNGGSGTDGQPGPHLSAFATMVKTPFYDRLVAIVVDGDRKDVLLVPEGQPVTLRASGGAGGSGGSGGHGGSGGSGGSGNPGGNGGRGAAGGQGGNGGNGGAGGAIDLVVDARFSDLRSQIRLDVSGGPGGSGGSGGSAGQGGSGGSGITPPSSSGQTPPPAQSGTRGGDGSSGASGTPGHQGPDGHANVTSGNPKKRFEGLSDITVL